VFEHGKRKERARKKAGARSADDANQSMTDSFLAQHASRHSVIVVALHHPSPFPVDPPSLPPSRTHLSEKNQEKETGRQNCETGAEERSVCLSVLTF